MYTIKVIKKTKDTKTEDGRTEIYTNLITAFRAFTSICLWYQSNEFLNDLECATFTVYLYKDGIDTPIDQHFFISGKHCE